MLSSQVLFYTIPFLASFVLAFFLTPIIRSRASAWGIVDEQNEPRKQHPSGAVPLLGGWAVIGSFLIVLCIAWLAGWLTDIKIHPTHILAIVVSVCLIALVGYVDDRFKLKPTMLIVVPVLVSLLVVILGIRVEFITNPFHAGTGPYGRSLLYLAPAIGAVFSFLWILGMMFTVKFLDGLDGLATGIGAIGAIILFVVSLFWDVPLSGTSVLTLIFAGSLLGFLPYNWHPAKIFFGESSLFIGFMLGVLSIISGAKIATALLVMGIPVLDVAWVIMRRVFAHRSPFKGDRRHLHFQLLDSGLTHRQAVLVLYAFTAFFGTMSIFLQSTHKAIALGILVIVMAVLVTVLVVFRKRSI